MGSTIKIISDFGSYLERSLSEMIIYLNMKNIASNHLDELLRLQNNNNKFFENFMTILIITNEQDFRVPVDQGLQLFTALRRNGVASETLIFPDEGHWVLGALDSKRWHEIVFGWMTKYIGQ